MKALLSIIAIFIAILPCYSAEKNVKLDLSEVKVYLSGAELTHTAKLKLKPGNNDFILENIANEISPNSINVLLSENATIMDVSEKYDYLKEEDSDNIVEKLNDSLKTIDYNTSELNNEIAALDEEASVLSQNKLISGKDKVMSVIDLKQVSQFIQESMLRIKNSKLKLSKEISEFHEIRNKIENQLKEINSKNTKFNHQLLITINSKTAQTIDLIVKYFINQAGWIPFYDIRVKDINSPLVFYQKANVWQNSGIDFKDIRLTMSTRNPAIYGNLPIINPVDLDFADTHVDKSAYVSTQNIISTSPGVMNSGNGYNLRGSRTNDETQIKITGLDIGNQFNGGFTIVNSTFATSVSAEFRTDLEYSIPSDGKPHYVDLETTEMPGIFEYYTAPKYRLESFLVAKITNWEGNNLIPGNANVYFEKSYIGKTDILPNIPLDTMSLSLGVDKGVIVTRDIIKDYTESKFLSKDIERFFGYKITVKNTKKSKIRITIEDQIPVSKNEDITVTLIDNSGGKVDPETGKVKWIVELESGKSLEKQLKFSVRHPSDKKISSF